MVSRRTVRGPDEMLALGEAFGRLLRGGDVLLLSGPLGAGKTQFVKGLARGLGIQGIVNSPTFTLMKPYSGRLALHHVDLYRLSGEAECHEIGLDDLIAPDTVIALEWPERFPRFGAESGIQLDIVFGDDPAHREVTIWSQLPRNQALISQALDGFGQAH